MSKLLAKLFGGAGGSVLEKLSGVADKFIQTKEEKAQFEKEMTEIMIKAEAEMQKNVTDRWQADLQHGNWLTRSVRPLVLIFLIVSKSSELEQSVVFFVTSKTSLSLPLLSIL